MYLYFMAYNIGVNAVTPLSLGGFSGSGMFQSVKTPLILISYLFLICCSEKSEKNDRKPNIQFVPSSVVQNKDTMLKSGIIHPKIACGNNTSHTYALYLPVYYSAEKKFPVIYFFDSHADGSLPVMLYKPIADKYGFILAGSNDSKNGLPWETVQQIVSNVLTDIKSKFSIDPERNYTSGFSGGSRVASAVAINLGGIAGVIGCGAGMPANNLPESLKFSFYGIVGNADFNMIEMKNLDRSFENSSISHHLSVFEGKHEWPPAGEMEDAMLFMEITAMKNNKILKNDSIIERFVLKQEEKLNAFARKKQVLELWGLCRKLSIHCYGLYDVNPYKEKMLALEKAPGFVNLINNETEKERLEILKQQEYTKAFISKDSDWWKMEIIKLRDNNTTESKRLLGFLGLIVYMYCGNAIKNNQLQQSELYLKIYSWLEPDNHEALYLAALYHIKMKQPSRAIASLESAISLGFKDKARMKNEQLFEGLKYDQAFISLLKKIDD